MKYLKLFEQFISESQKQDTKIQILRVKEVEHSDQDFGELTKEVSNRCFTSVYMPSYKNEQEKLNSIVNLDLPMIYYGKREGWTADFINEVIRENRKKVYNVPSEMKKTGDKVSFHKIFGDVEFIPKTVFSIDEAEGLTYPVIAKPSDGMSGIGIEKFDSYEDLKSSNGKFDLYSQCVDFEREFRALCVKDNVIVVYERVPIIKDNKTVSTKKRDEAVSFLYVEQDIEKFPLVKELGDLVKEFRNKIDLDLYSVDFFADQDNKLWMIEGNASSGLGSTTLSRLYPAILKDQGMSEPSDELKDFLNKTIKEYRETLKKDFPKEYKKSLSPA